MWKEICWGDRKTTKMGETSNSKIAEHSWDKDHRIQWNQAEIIHMYSLEYTEIPKVFFMPHHRQ
jgi:hypothetical protein